jgi:aspartyl protease family protein
MMATAWVLALVGMAAWFGGALDRRENPNQSPATLQTADAVEVTLKRNRQGHYVATGTINGRQVRFLLDTGASLVSVPAALAEQLALPRGQDMMFNTANGVSRGYLTRLNDLSLGGIRLTNVDAGVAPGMSGEQVLLGMNVLQTLDILQSGDVMVLRQPAPARANG